jgi:hypothetical protein
MMGGGAHNLNTILSNRGIGLGALTRYRSASTRLPVLNFLSRAAQLNHQPIAVIRLHANLPSVSLESFITLYPDEG